MSNPAIPILNQIDAKVGDRFTIPGYRKFLRHEWRQGHRAAVYSDELQTWEVIEAEPGRILAMPTDLPNAAG